MKDCLANICIYLLLLKLTHCMVSLQGNADLSQKFMRARVAFQARIKAPCISLTSFQLLYCSTAGLSAMQL